MGLGFRGVSTDWLTHMATGTASVPRQAGVHFGQKRFILDPCSYNSIIPLRVRDRVFFFSFMEHSVLRPDMETDSFF